MVTRTDMLRKPTMSPANPEVLLSLVLVHLGGEERTVEVIGIWQNKVQIRWGGMGSKGVYALDLGKNILVGTRNQWHAKDIEAVRAYYRARRAHQDSMKH